MTWTGSLLFDADKARGPASAKDRGSALYLSSIKKIFSHRLLLEEPGYAIVFKSLVFKVSQDGDRCQEKKHHIWAITHIESQITDIAALFTGSLFHAILIFSKTSFTFCKNRRNSKRYINQDFLFHISPSFFDVNIHYKLRNIPTLCKVCIFILLLHPLHNGVNRPYISNLYS